MSFFSIFFSYEWSLEQCFLQLVIINVYSCPSTLTYFFLRANFFYHWLSPRIFKTIERLTIQCLMIKVVCSNLRNSIWIRRNISIISHNCKNVWLLNDIFKNISVIVPLAQVWIGYLTKFSFQNHFFCNFIKFSMTKKLTRNSIFLTHLRSKKFPNQTF
jgi:hypothetical protein